MEDKTTNTEKKHPLVGYKHPKRKSPDFAIVKAHNVRALSAAIGSTDAAKALAIKSNTFNKFTSSGETRLNYERLAGFILQGLGITPPNPPIVPRAPKPEDKEKAEIYAKGMVERDGIEEEVMLTLPAGTMKLAEMQELYKKAMDGDKRALAHLRASDDPNAKLAADRVEQNLANDAKVERGMAMADALNQTEHMDKEEAEKFFNETRSMWAGADEEGPNAKTRHYMEREAEKALKHGDIAAEWEVEVTRRPTNWKPLGDIAKQMAREKRDAPIEAGRYDAKSLLDKMKVASDMVSQATYIFDNSEQMLKTAQAYEKQVLAEIQAMIEGGN